MPPVEALAEPLRVFLFGILQEYLSTINGAAAGVLMSVWELLVM